MLGGRRPQRHFENDDGRFASHPRKAKGIAIAEDADRYRARRRTGNVESRGISSEHVNAGNRDSARHRPVSTYIKNNKQYMRYASLRKSGIPTVSGATEGACKSLVMIRTSRGEPSGDGVSRDPRAFQPPMCFLPKEAVPRVTAKFKTCQSCTGRRGIYWVSPVDELGTL